VTLVEPGWMTPFIEQTLPVVDIDPLVAQLQHFCDVIEGKARPIITVGDALQSLRAVEAVCRSIDTGSTIALNELKD
jgi:predicted dehydrogenase